MSDRIIAVVGATGAQGSGLVRAILADPTSGFKARAITRNPNSDKARALAALGADVVAADTDTESTLENAFHGAYGVFCLTNYWEHLSPEREIRQAESQARAAGNCGARHVVWSTLEDTRKLVPLRDTSMPTLMGNYKVPHFDTKGESDDFFRDLGVPTTFMLTSFYWDNLIYFGLGPKPGPDGVLELTLPMGDAALPGIAAEDIGICAYGIFRNGDSMIGQTVGVAGEHLTGTQMAAGLTRALGRTVRYNSVSPDVFRSFGFPGADDLGNMFQYKRDFWKPYQGARDIAVARALNPSLLTFDAWLAKHAAQIPLA